MKTIKINFQNLWGGDGLDAWKNTYFSFLNKYYKFELSNTPDFIAFSNTYQKGMPNIKCKAQRIFFMGEIMKVDMNKCEWAFGYNYLNHPKYFRMPYYVTRLLYTGIPFDQLIKRDNTITPKTKFCNFLFSNNKNGETRNNFFKKLAKYKKVDAAGQSLNNMGNVLPGRAHRKVGNQRIYPEKMEFLKQYKFTIAYENDRARYINTSNLGNTTEKIVEPMLVNSIPIYRGNPRIAEEFNPKSFINYHDFNNEEAMIKQIIKIDNDDKLYQNMLKEPWLHGNKLSKYLDKKLLINQFRKIFG